MVVLYHVGQSSLQKITSSDPHLSSSGIPTIRPHPQSMVPNSGTRRFRYDRNWLHAYDTDEAIQVQELLWSTVLRNVNDGPERKGNGLNKASRDSHPSKSCRLGRGTWSDLLTAVNLFNLGYGGDRLGYLFVGTDHQRGGRGGWGRSLHKCKRVQLKRPDFCQVPVPGPRSTRKCIHTVHSDAIEQTACHSLVLRGPDAAFVGLSCHIERLWCWRGQAGRIFIPEPHLPMSKIHDAGCDDPTTWRQ